MTYGRDLLGKLVMVVFILFNLVMLGLAGLAYQLKDIPPEAIRAAVLAKITGIGIETRDDRKLDAKEKEDIEWGVDEIMKVVVFVQQKELTGILILWAIGVGVLGVPVYFTRPQPI